MITVTSGKSKVGVGVIVGVGVMVGVGVTVGVSVIVEVYVGDGVCVGVAVNVGVELGVCVDVGAARNARGTPQPEITIATINIDKLAMTGIRRRILELEVPQVEHPDMFGILGESHTWSNGTMGLVRARSQ